MSTCTCCNHSQLSINNLLTPSTSTTAPMQLVLAVVLVFASCALALNNGAARTPPMGWLSWEMYRHVPSFLVKSGV